jgi:hypothetical protein
MILTSRSLVLCALLGASAAALAQAPAGGNLVVNGDFAKFTSQDNLWDGVDSSGLIAGWQRGTYAVTESGRVGGLDMPISVNFVDMNGDKLPDLVTADPAGFLRVHFNSGTPTEPKFSYGEVIPLFPPQIAKDNAYDRGLWTAPHSVPKIALYDWNRRGALDMIIGNYCGDILLVPNTGGSQAPAFAQPTNYGKVRVPTSNKRPWGNLFAPCPVDWNKDGKTDLLVGEGSYSANAVFVLLNQSGSNEPKFTEEQRYYLCYGDGREQLVPTVADYNGDGLPDVLVGDRLGTVGVFLNQGSWKPGTELPLATNIRFGNTEKLGGAVAPYAADYNGDGLFDLLIGKTNGRVAVAINKGTKSEPKFDAPLDIKGVDTLTEKINPPANWTMDAGNSRGNIYGYFSVAPGETSPNGGKVLKAGFFPSPNKVIKLTPIAVDGRDDTDFFRYWREEWEPIPAQWAGYSRSTDSFLIRQQLGALKVGTTYQLSFKVKGTGIEGGVATVAYLGAAENVTTKFKRGERGAVKADKNEAHEEVLVTENFSGNNAWKTVEKTFQIGFKERDVKKLEETTLAILEFKFTLPQFGANCEICDVQLVAKGK